MQEFKPDIVGISTNTFQWEYTKVLPDWIKEFSDIPVVFGGIHPTIYPEDVIKEKNIDMLCIGEGDYPMLELLQKLEGNEDYSNIKNLWVKDAGGKVIKNPLRKLIVDLDTLPFPNREAFGYDEILNQFDGTLIMLSGKACPYDCSFCNNGALKKIFKEQGRFVRRHSPEYVVEEIQIAVNKYDIKNVAFIDDDFRITESGYLNSVTYMQKNSRFTFG